VAMKNHYSGHKHGLLPESLAYTEVRERKSFPSVTQLISVEPRVCSLGGGRSNLVFQIQNWVLYTYSAGMVTTMSLEDDIRICKHLYLRRSAQEYFARYPDSDITDKFKHLACRVCGIEYDIALRDYGAEGKAIVVTKWVDLGAGLEWSDPTWTRITNDSRYCPPVRSSRRTWQLFLDAICLQEQFSLPNGRTTSRNHACLMEKQYRNWIFRSNDTLYWSIPIPGLHSNVN
jgi:hypothetical protein